MFGTLIDAYGGERMNGCMGMGEVNGCQWLSMGVSGVDTINMVCYNKNKKSGGGQWQSTKSIVSAAIGQAIVLMGL